MLITDEEITSYSLPKKIQFASLIALGAVISWASFSSGKYFAYKKILVHKEKEIQQANLINLDLQTRIDSLQGNLVRLNSYFDTVKSFDYNRNELNKKFKKFDQTSSVKKNNHDKIILSKLEKKEKIISDINQNTLNRISELEEIVSITGLPLSSIKPEFSFNINNQSDIVSSSNQGGPNTHQVFDVEYSEQNIDQDINFDENVSKLFF